MARGKNKGNRGIIVVLFILAGLLLSGGDINLHLFTTIGPTKNSCIAGGGQWTAGEDFYILNTFVDNKTTEEYYFEDSRHIVYNPIYIRIPKESYVSSAVLDVSGEKIVVSEDCLSDSCTAPDITTEDYNCNYQAVGVIGAGVSSKTCNFFGSTMCYGSYCRRGKVHTEYYTAVKGGSSCEVKISNGCVWNEITCYGNPVSCEKGETVSDVQMTTYGCIECSWSSYGGYRYNCGGCGSTSKKDPMLYMEWNYTSYPVNPTISLYGTPVFNAENMYTKSTSVDITEELNNALEVCDPEGIYCNIPIDASALSSGTIKFENLEINLADKECICPSGTMWTGTACRPEDENYTEFITSEEHMENICINTGGMWNDSCKCPESYEVTDGYYISNSVCEPYTRELVYNWDTDYGCVKDEGDIVYLPYKTTEECEIAVEEGIEDDFYEVSEDIVYYDVVSEDNDTSTSTPVSTDAFIDSDEDTKLITDETKGKIYATVIGLGMVIVLLRSGKLSLRKLRFRRRH